MSKIRTSFFTVIYTILCFNIFNAQNPSYFILGQETLKNKDIYSIHETDDGRIFVATDQGLYRFVNNKMIILADAPKQKGKAVFNLKSDTTGAIYGYNLSGQVFTVIKNQLKVIYELPKRYLGSNLDIFIVDKEKIIIVSKAVVELSKNDLDSLWDSKILKVQDELLHAVKVNDQVEVYGSLEDSILIIDKFHIRKKFNDSNLRFQSRYRIPFYLDSSLYSTSILNRIGASSRTELFKYYQFNNSEIWRLDSKRGISLFYIKNGRPEIKEEFFEDLFVSTVFQNKNGTLFVGTFGKGLLVIPNTETKSYNVGPRSNFKSIAVSAEGKAYISDISTGISSLSQNNRTQLLRGNDLYKIPEQLFILPSFDNIIHEGHKELFYNDGRFYGAVKSVQLLKNNSILAATSIGIQCYSGKQEYPSYKWEYVGSQKNTVVLSDVKERCKSVFLDEKNNILYIASQSGLMLKRGDKELEELLIDDKPIIVNDFEWKDDILWCATQSNGILVYNKGRLIDRINLPNVSRSSYINKIIIRNDILYILHSNGFISYDIESGRWNYYGKRAGIPNNEIKDFEIGPNSIWFIGNTLLIKKPINSITNLKVAPKVSVDSIRLSGERIFPNNKNIFDYNKNLFEVYTSSYDPYFEDELRLKFKLVGLDNDWQEHKVNGLSPLKYNYLPPGDYKFILKSSLRGQENLLLNFDFQIAEVYYKRWWFYFMIISVIIGAMLFYFENDRKKQNRKTKILLKEQQLLQEASESELKALRSQMNPHFIFNSLNSIQNLVLKNNTERSYDYLVSFSKLVRSALIFSEAGRIKLNEEIEFLENYLKLEKLRFKDNFNYVINVPKTNELYIPSLFIQPFVENSIVHGLFHKTGSKELLIDLSISQNKLLCVIEDNGIGRKKSLEIKKRQLKKHDSFAVNALNRRIEILESQGYDNIGFSITDINRNDEIVGTKVSLTLPILDGK